MIEEMKEKMDSIRQGLALVDAVDDDVLEHNVTYSWLLLHDPQKCCILRWSWRSHLSHSLYNIIIGLHCRFANKLMKLKMRH